MAIQKPTARLASLDSIRGLLALSVFAFHIALSYTPELVGDNPPPPNSFIDYLIVNSPLRIFWSGHQAVVGFFVLSGFVLSLSFLSLARADSFWGSWLRFATRRIFRLYPAYLIAIPLAMVAVYYSQNSVDYSQLLGHLTMIGLFNQNAYNTGIWSLVVEMRISLIFPLILLFSQRYPWWLSLITSWSIGSTLGLTSGSAEITSWAQTPAAIPLFVIGCITAKHRAELAGIWRGLRTLQQVLLTLVAILIYTLPGSIPYGWILRSHWLLDPAIALSLIPLLSAALAGGKITHLLELRPLHWLGERAYGIYLIHPPLLVASAALASRTSYPLPLLQTGSFLILLILAHLLYIGVEQPFIKIGHNLTSRSWGNK